MKQALESMAALAILIGIIALGLAGIALPTFGRLAAEDARVAGLERAVAAFQARVRDAEATEIRTASQDVLLQAGSLPLAVAAMQDILNDAAQASGVLVERIRTEDSASPEGLIKVGLFAGVSGTLEAIADFLYRLESGTPYIVVDEFEIRRHQGRTEAAGAPLAAGVRLSGFLAASRVER